MKKLLFLSLLVFFLASCKCECKCDCESNSASEEFEGSIIGKWKRYDGSGRTMHIQFYEDGTGSYETEGEVFMGLIKWVRNKNFVYVVPNTTTS